MTGASPRIARRRAATRSTILDVAAKRLADAGPEGVRLEEIAAEADVARGTLYSHFPTKDGLMQEIMRPVLELAVTRARGLSSLPPEEAIDRLLKLYLELWRTYPSALRLTYRVRERPLGPLAPLHQRFVRGVHRIFAAAAAAGLLRTGDPALAAQVLTRAAVPLLELLSDHPRGDSLFIESAHGLLLSASHGRGQPASKRSTGGD
jgi:AcrR family transcriptional regulator